MLNIKKMVLYLVVSALTITAIGSNISIEALKMIGAKILVLSDVRSEEEISKLYASIVDSKAVIIENEVYELVKSDLENIFQTLRTPPLLIIVPSLHTLETSRLKELHQKISLAVGVQLKW